LGFTAPQHCIGYIAPFKKTLVGSTSHLHRDKNRGYGSKNLIPAGESEMQKLQINVRPCYSPLTIMPGLSSGPNYWAKLACPRPTWGSIWSESTLFAFITHHSYNTTIFDQRTQKHPSSTFKHYVAKSLCHLLCDESFSQMVG